MAFSQRTTALAFAAVLGMNCAEASSDAPTMLRGAAAQLPCNVSAAAARDALMQRGASDPKYDHYFDKNAFAPYGATDIDADDTAPSGLTPQQCEDRCTSDSSCMCVTQERATGKCWKRASCDPSQWTSQWNEGYNVYMKSGSAPPAPSPMTPSTGWFTLQLFLNPDFCLDLKGGQTFNGNAAQLLACNGWSGSSMEPYWTTGSVDAEITGSQIRWAVSPLKCLDVKDHQTANGTPLQVWDCIQNDYDQLFYFDSTIRPAGSESIPRPVGLLRWKDHPSKCVVAKPDGPWGGNPIVVADCASDHPEQYWVNDFVER